MPGRGRTSTRTERPLSALNALAAKLTSAKTTFSGGPWRSTMTRGAPAVKVTDVSEGDGPAVSSTMAVDSGITRVAAGETPFAPLLGRPPHAASARQRPLARPQGLRDIPVIDPP